MNDETVQEVERAEPALRPVSLTDEDRRLLAALLDELIGRTQDGRPTPQLHDAEESGHDGDAAGSTALVSHGR